MEQEHKHNLIRVRLGARFLSSAPSRRSPHPFAMVPYRVRYGCERSAESSARSRGFRFALLSGIAAYLSRASLVIVPESGQGALGPVLVPVGQAYEDYRSHPLFTDRMNAFLSALFEHNVDYAYPRLWYTKAETLAAFIDTSTDRNIWTHTRSCWQGHRHASVLGGLRQCGICAACMLRRMTLHTIGATEDKATYIWEDLTADRFQDGAVKGFRKAEPKGAQYEHAVAGTLHLDHLAGLLESIPNRHPLEKQVHQLSRSLALPEQDVQHKLERLLKQHGLEWNNFVQSLGAPSFVAQWASGGLQYVAG